MSLIVPYILLYILTFGIMMVYKIEVMFNLGFPFLLIASVMLRLHMIRMFKIKSSGPFAECCTVVLCSPCSIAQSSYNLIWENLFLLLTFCFCFLFLIITHFLCIFFLFISSSIRIFSSVSLSIILPLSSLLFSSVSFSSLLSSCLSFLLSTSLFAPFILFSYHSFLPCIPYLSSSLLLCHSLTTSLSSFLLSPSHFFSSPPFSNHLFISPLFSFFFLALFFSSFSYFLQFPSFFSSLFFCSFFLSVLFCSVLFCSILFSSLSPNSLLPFHLSVARHVGGYRRVCDGDLNPTLPDYYSHQAWNWVG